MNLNVKQSMRIPLKELTLLLQAKESKIAEELVLKTGESERWASDYDLYKASLVLGDSLTHAMLAKTLERITILPAEATGEKKRPISHEELEELRTQVNEQ